MALATYARRRSRLNLLLNAQSDLCPQYLKALECELSSDSLWSARHLSAIRGALSLLQQSRRLSLARLAALGEAGPTLLRARIALLDSHLDHFARLVDVLSRARAHLEELTPPEPGSFDQPNLASRAAAFARRDTGFENAMLRCDQPEAMRADIHE